MISSQLTYRQQSTSSLIDKKISSIRSLESLELGNGSLTIHVPTEQTFPIIYSYPRNFYGWGIGGPEFSSRGFQE